MYKEEKIIGGRLYYRTDPEGEWTLYTESDLITKYQHMNNSFYSAMGQITELETENKQLRDALQWYALTVKHCKKDGNGGDIARHMLVEDAGKRADNALKEAGDEES